METGCRYFKPGRYHETIRITTGIEELTDKTVHLNHRITLASDDTLTVDVTPIRSIANTHLDSSNIPLIRKIVAEYEKKSPNGTVAYR